MRGNVKRMFHRPANANVSAWFRECSDNDAFLESTAQNLHSVRIDRNGEVHPEPPLISRLELADIINTFSTGPPNHIALSAACDVMRQLFEEFFPNCLCGEL
jgi:hypothetical protein